MIPFRTLCARLRSAIKAMPPDARAALGAGLPARITAGSSYSYRINASDFLGLCWRLGIDPLTGGAVRANADPGSLCLQSIGAGCAIQRHLKGLSLRAAADEIGVSAATLHRLEQNLPISIESILAVCEFIGVHPFGYMQAERRRAA